jgi:crotonobetainyl-CoA:carnitine CoA-transferase CaiB-like acyl-CoA transferase
MATADPLVRPCERVKARDGQGPRRARSATGKVCNGEVRTRVLDGLRVVDLSTEIAGPYCTKLLADAGAEVVKVEPSEGDAMRRWRSGALFEFLHTSKRSVVGAANDPAVFELCARADVVIESGAPGTLDVHALRARSPALVVVSITPFGQDGPWRDRAATEFTLQAWCGSTGTRGDPERPPVAAGGRIGEWVAGAYGAVAAVAAWRAAAAGGRGEHVDLALLDSMALTMNTYTSVFAEFLGWPVLRRPTRTFEVPSIEPSSDGYVAFTTNSAQQFADFLVMIGRPDLIEDVELARALTRFKRRHEMLELIHAHTKKFTTAELLEQASELRIPSGPVGNGATVTTFDHFVETQTFVPNPSGRFVQPRVPYRISGLEARPFAPAPAVGDGGDPRAVAAGWAERPQGASRDGSDGDAPELPLVGIRVLDCTAWWAGPAATHMLGTLGADVIKIESVTRPDLMRYTSTQPPTEEQWWEWGPLYHGANHNKRGITLDLTRPEGRALLLRLAADADVLLENFTPRVMDNFELGWDILHGVNPRLVMVRLPAYGLRGPWRDRTGFAQTMEGITGMAWVTGWPDGPPLLPRGACDPLAAMHAVFATMLALRDRDSSDVGRLVEVTMIEAALNAAAEQVVEYGASRTLLERDGNRGSHAAPQNVYPCSGDEEWLALAVTDEAQWRLLREHLGDPGWARDPELATVEGRRAAHDRIDAELGAWFATRDARATADALSRGGVPAGYVVDGRDIARNPQLLHRGYFGTERHPVTGAHPIPTIPFRFTSRATRGWLTRPAPTLGEHNREILGGELGLDDDELAALESAGIIGSRPTGA